MENILIMKEQILKIGKHLKKGIISENEAIDALLLLLDINKCSHPYKDLERNQNGIWCDNCKQQVSYNPNIF